MDIGRVLFVAIEDFSDEIKKLLEEYRPGGILLFPKILRNEISFLEFMAFASERKDFLISSDHEGGQMETIPYIPSSLGNMALGMSNEDATEMYAERSGRIMRELGFNMVFAPVLDVHHEGSSAVIGQRSYGDDPHLVYRHGRAAIRGYRRAGIIACAKHFPGHGRAVEDSHHGKVIVDVSEEELWETDLLPFRGAVEEGVEFIMTAHITVPSVDSLPATLSKRFIGDILRRRMKYRGLVISDAIEMKAIWDNFSVEEMVEKFFEAGGDMILLTNLENLPVVYEALERIYREKQKIARKIEDSVRRVEDVIARYRSNGGFGFMRDVARRAFSVEVRGKVKDVVLVMPSAENLSPADTTAKYYDEIENAVKRIMNVSRVDKYEIEQGPVPTKYEYPVIDIVVDAFRYPKALEAHKKLAEENRVLYVIIRDPYDGKLLDGEKIVTRSMNPLAIYEALKKIRL